MGDITFISHTARVQGTLVRHLEEALVRAGKAIAQTAQDNMVPGHALDTGFMQQHTSYEVQDPLHGQVHVDADYAAYPEFGTYKMAPRPFIIPAITTEWPRALTAEDPTWET